jgi:hypothetical protein
MLPKMRFAAYILQCIVCCIIINSYIGNHGGLDQSIPHKDRDVDVKSIPTFITTQQVLPVGNLQNLTFDITKCQTSPERKKPNEYSDYFFRISRYLNLRKTSVLVFPIINIYIKFEPVDIPFPFHSFW